MTRSLVLLTALLVLAACANVDDAPVAETTAVADSTATTAEIVFAGTALPFDTSASTVAWQAAKVTRTHDGGFRDFSGALYLDGEVVTGAEITIGAASIFSDEERLTRHLLSDDFFDVAVYPEALFRTTAIAPLANGEILDDAPDATHQVSGTLTMRGQSNAITFPATVAVSAENVTAQAQFIINRQDWGLSYRGAPDDLIRDQVQVRLDMTAPRPQPDA